MLIYIYMSCPLSMLLCMFLRPTTRRLWCNLELAAFASSGHAPQKMQFVPAWLAPWLLASICTDMISVSLHLGFLKIAHPKTKIQKKISSKIPKNAPTLKRPKARTFAPSAS